MIGCLMNELESKWLWPNLRCYPNICLEELRSTTKDVREANLRAEI
jgi:hypothetical protein